MLAKVHEDWRTAPVDDRLRATLGFLEKLTLRPGELARADAVAVLSTGVTEQALVDGPQALLPEEMVALGEQIARVAEAVGRPVNR